LRLTPLFAPQRQTELWRPIVCLTCSHPLGRQFLHPPSESKEAYRTLKLAKYALALPLSLGDGESNEEEGQEVGWGERYLANDLLELGDSHRSYHFVLEDEEAAEAEGKERLLVRPTFLFLSLSSSDTPVEEVED
jgi:hypothetical protein